MRSLHIILSNLRTRRRVSNKSHCLKNVRIWSYSGLYSVRMREIWTRINPNIDTFHAVPMANFQKFEIFLYIIFTLKEYPLRLMQTIQSDTFVLVDQKKYLVDVWVFLVLMNNFHNLDPSS